MIQSSDRARRLPAYPLADLPAAKRRLLDAGVDVIDLGAGDNDTPPPAPVVRALQAAVDDPAMSRYGFQQGLPAFRQAITRYLARRFDLAMDPGTEVLPLIGSKEGLAHLPAAVVNPGEVAILPEPGYQAYLGGAVLAGAEPVIVPLRADRAFRLELEELPESTLRRAKVVFLNYPNNPTAAVASLEYLARTVAVCRRHGMVLAYDNAYCDLTFDGYVAPSIFQVPGAREVAVEFFSCSKTFAMTGWRLGWAVGRRELIAALAKLKSYVDTGPFLAVQRAGVEALDHAETLVPPLVAELVRRRDATVAALAGAGLPVAAPQATMYLWVPLPDGLPSRAFAETAREEEGVIVLPGAGFGPAGEGYVRIALTTSAERLREASERLGRCLVRMRERSVAVPA